MGKYSPNPDVPIYENDWNNFGPAFGFSWSVPQFKQRTVLRGGYGVNYQGRFAGGGCSESISTSELRAGPESIREPSHHDAVAIEHRQRDTPGS